MLRLVRWLASGTPTLVDQGRAKKRGEKKGGGGKRKEGHGRKKPHVLF